MTTATAPGKVILFGEHAVVYGRPAIAIPVRQVHAQAQVDDLPGEPPGRILIEAPNVGRQVWLHEAAADDPLALAVRLALEEIQPKPLPAARIRITSTIPVASGLGSGAAVSIALLRALGAHWKKPLTNERVSALAFQVEKLHHGTPSGIDNTVIAFEQPVYFRRGHPGESIRVGSPLDLVVAVSDRPSPTAAAVTQVRERWQADRAAVEALLGSISDLVVEARPALEAAELGTLGALMDQNHALLARLGVSTPALDRLVEAARSAGGAGAKLSGAGLGGNIIAAADPRHLADIELALQRAGAVQTIHLQVGP